MIIDRIKALKSILLLSLLNASLFQAFVPQGFSLLRIFTASTLLTSVMLLIVFFFRIERINFLLHPYFKVLFCLLFAWSFFTIFRSLSTNSKDLISLFGHYLMGWVWIMPLAIIFGLNILNWIYIFNFLGKLLMVGVFLSPFLLFTTDENIGNGILQFLFIFPFLFLTIEYQKSFYQKMIFVSIIIFALVSIFVSQRINAVYILLPVIFFTIEILRNRNVVATTKVFIYAIVALVVLMLFLEAQDMYSNYTKNKTLSTDTRTFLVDEFYKDMSNSELITGRGALGTYYSPYFALLKRSRIHGGDSPVRSVNEIGYLEIVLKGGYIMVALYLLIMIPAAYLGIFKSKNLIARMCGYIIFIILIIWIVSYPLVYSTLNLLLWMAVGTAISPVARNITDGELLKFQKENIIE